MKRKAGKIDLDILRDKGIHFLLATGELKDYKITYSGLSMEDMQNQRLKCYTNEKYGEKSKSLR